MGRTGRLIVLLAMLALLLGATMPQGAHAMPAANGPLTPELRAQGQEQHAASPTTDQFDERILWSLLAVALVVPAGGIFYLLKKRLGAFPENPEWVAPISIMRSRDLPDEHTYAGAEGAADAHGHH